MGQEQWYNTFWSQSGLTHDSSPALSDLIGSLRPKIYSILKMIEEEADKYEKTREHYKILMDDISTQDKASIVLIQFVAQKSVDSVTPKTKCLKYQNLRGFERRDFFSMCTMHYIKHSS